MFLTTSIYFCFLEKSVTFRTEEFAAQMEQQEFGRHISKGFFLKFSLLFKSVGADIFLQATEYKIRLCMYISGVFLGADLSHCKYLAVKITESKFLLTCETCHFSLGQIDKTER